ncbi:efflux transporter outer membrane subunit [Deefgea rivuli]|uniref:efflux transporter outer membrane subunit n=1 Tax=Deefgea rivuli TaxID=400948 RepID=UPI000488006C|nr:TolC family protein [Deefgea rivuli]
MQSLKFTKLLQLSVVLWVAMLSACTTLGPQYVRPSSELPADWQSTSLNDAPKIATDPQLDTWWHHFNDPVLNQLISETLSKNHNLRTAGLRILEARAQLGIAGSMLYPQLQQVSGSVLETERRQFGGGTPSSSQGMRQYSASFNLGWEIDFWGRFRRGIEAADASYFATLAKYDDLQVLMVAQTADLYVSIRILEARLQIVHDNAAIQKRSLEITQRLFKSGNESELDVQQAKTQYLSTVSSIPELEASLRKTQNALATILARPPGPLAEMVGGKGIIPSAGLNLIVDLPADALLRRPDVRVAERQMAAQSALIGVAEADLYPSLSLLGSLGLSATSLSGSPTNLDLGIGPSLKWNVFDYGRIRNNVRVQDARFQQLAEVYQDTLLQAARDVDDAAVSYAKNLEQMSWLAQTEVAARRSLDIAMIQYREGISDFQRVLDAQRSLFSQQDRVVSNRGNAISSLIAIYKAMGGGWEQGRSRPLLDDETLQMMKMRTDWGDLLDTPLPATP